MLQWRNWHTRQIQTLFSPGSTPGWSTIFEINSGGDFVNNISAVAIGMLIAAHREGDEENYYDKHYAFCGTPIRRTQWEHFLEKD